jgi:hypothetical protein
MFVSNNYRQKYHFRRSTLIGRPPFLQAGITVLGSLILIIFVGLFTFEAIILTPTYLNYMKVVGILDDVAKEFDSDDPTRRIVRKSISQRFNVENVNVITAKDIKIVADNGKFQLEVVYDHTIPVIANVSFTVHFNKKVLLRR